MSDKIDKKIQQTFDSIVKPRSRSRKTAKTAADADHRTKLTERRIQKLVRGEERRRRVR
jgi:hypothetical protein